jgi:hypothetical protein
MIGWQWWIRRVDAKWQWIWTQYIIVDEIKKLINADKTHVFLNVIINRLACALSTQSVVCADGRFVSVRLKSVW